MRTPYPALLTRISIWRPWAATTAGHKAVVSSMDERSARWVVIFNEGWDERRDVARDSSLAPLEE